MTSKVFEMQKDAILRAMGARIEKAQRDRARVAKTAPEHRKAGALAACDKEIARLQADTDKALADVEKAAAKAAGTEYARRERERFAVECIEAGIVDFTASDEDDTIRRGFRLARVAA